jgi:hypothetical protein
MATRYFSENADDKHWNWLVLVEDDTTLSVAKIIELIQVLIFFDQLDININI